MSSSSNDNNSAELMTIIPLGGGQEVGRSCILLNYQNRTVMLDCGCHPGREGSDSLPFFDAIDNIEMVDLVLITHFHLDHCAALPYFTEKTPFKGRIFMTHATKAVMRLLLADNIRLQHNRAEPLYSEKELQACIDKIEVVDYHQTIECKGIKFTTSAAGHVLGAAMFMIDIDGIRVLYTGDYSLEEDRHLIQAEVPTGGPPDVIIVESTFGITNLPQRDRREKDFTNTVESIVSRGGSCLIPVFALGRAQELLLILDEYWQSNEHLQHIPVFYASKLASKSLRVYQTFINMMNSHIRDLMDQFYNPFKLRHIKNIQDTELNMFGPCVVMASPGFLQSGISRQLFEAWCDNDLNGVIIAGYTVEGTLANDLLEYPTEIKCLDNRIKPRRCQIENISFSAHVDYTQNKKFIKAVMPDYIILVHGEKNQMRRLKDGLENEMRKGQWSTQHHPSIAIPENGMKVKLRFRKNILAEVMGRAAGEVMQQISGDGGASATEIQSVESVVHIPDVSILVTENFTSKIVAADELASFTNCRFNRINQKIIIPLPKVFVSNIPLISASQSHPQRPSDPSSLSETTMMLARDCLSEVFDAIDVKDDFSRIVIEGMVHISFGSVQDPSSDSTVPSNKSNPNQQLIVSWFASPLSDTIADSVVCIITHMFSMSNLLQLSLKANRMDGVKGSKRKRKVGTAPSDGVVGKESHE